jgi:Ca2+-binding RTX toxin-like protein
MNLNVLVRGQSNAILAMESNGWAGHGALRAEVQRLLGFDGSADTISLVYDRYDPTKATAFGGTALIGDWLKANNGDWRQGWSNGAQENALLNLVGGLPAGQKADPTATLWFHSEYDSNNAGMTAEQWTSAVRFDAAAVRAALGQGAATTPYLFVSAMPYWGTTEGHNAIRQGMEQLAADGGFNAAIAARTLDTDIDNDDFDGSQATREYGGPHMDPEDGMQTMLRAARAIAEEFAAYAKPGSPVALAGGNIADAGPQAIHAEVAAANQLRIDVSHDHAAGFQALDPDAAAGVGWSVLGAGGQVTGTAAQLVDGDTLLVTFSGNVDPAGTLFYGYGYGRLSGADGSGRGNAVYDDQGLPIWVGASGLKVGTWATPVEGSAAAPTAPAPTPTPTPTPTSAPAPAPVDTSSADAGPDKVVTGTEGSDTLRGTAGRDLVSGGGGQDRLSGLDGADTLSGGDGHDTLMGGAGADSLAGGAGNDLLRGDAGNDSIATGAGRDIVSFTTGDGADRVTDFLVGTDKLRLPGVDTGTVTASVATLDGVSGLKLVLAGGESLFLDGVGAATARQLGLAGSFALAPAAPVPVTTALNAITGTSGDDSLPGTAGADSILGHGGNDDLRGLDGNDLLRGGTGADMVGGGAGTDTFVFARGDGQDWILDFAPGAEKIRLEGITATEVTQTFETRWGHWGVAIDLGQGDGIFLDWATQKLAASDFVFG